MPLVANGRTPFDSDLPPPPLCSSWNHSCYHWSSEEASGEETCHTPGPFSASTPAALRAAGNPNRVCHAEIGSADFTGDCHQSRSTLMPLSQHEGSDHHLDLRENMSYAFSTFNKLCGDEKFTRDGVEIPTRPSITADMQGIKSIARPRSRCGFQLFSKVRKDLTKCSKQASKQFLSHTQR